MPMFAPVVKRHEELGRTYPERRTAEEPAGVTGGLCGTADQAVRGSTPSARSSAATPRS